MSTHQLSAALAASPVFAEVDRELAALFVRRAGIDGEPAMAIALATALLSRARQNGHSALTLDDLAEQATELAEANGGSADEGAWPLFPCGNTTWWRANLAVESVVSDGNRSTPLVLSGDVLQFKRLYDGEKRIAARVSALLAGGADGLRIITGGPGTGKTTRAARMLLEMVEQNPDLRIALAAPTGKAADRVSESIRQRLDEANAPDAVRARVPKDATTLHRLLGYNPSSDRYRARRGTELAFDVVIIDEASMIDVLMMDALLVALASGTKLLLVGDHNQLASVDAGDVLGTLCRAGFSRAVGEPMHDAISALTHSHRFANHPSIGAIADAILAGDGDRTMAVLQDPAHNDVNWLTSAAGDSALLAPLVPHLERCLAASSPQELLQALDGFRVLAPEREGKLGVQGINALVEQWLRRRGAMVSDPWYHGRPVLVTANDYATNVFNGDLGVVWNENGEPLVHFAAAMGTTRAISPARLPDSVTAWAMTVHKAQGSEFDDVLVVLPARGSRVIGRELLYTAVTRARQRVTVVGEEGVIRGGVGRTASRQSGLGRMLANA